MMKVHTIDCDYLFPEFAAAYLVVENGRAVLIENNTEHCIPKIQKALSDVGVTFDQIDHVIVTHAHLDHAGASGKLMQLCPNATFVSHPKAIQHLVDPKRLIDGVKAVYGEQRFQELYGGVKAVPSERSRAMADGEILQWQGVRFQFIHTRGHANHHCCIIEPKSQTVFTGDTFGLRYPALQANGLFILPTTSPTGYEPEQAISTVQRIAALGMEKAYLTHFGLLEEIDEAAKQLTADLEFSKTVVEEAAVSNTPKEFLQKYCFERLEHYLQRRIQAVGLDWESSWRLLALDLELNAAGMAHAVGYLRKSSQR